MNETSKWDVRTFPGLPEEILGWLIWSETNIVMKTIVWFSLEMVAAIGDRLFKYSVHPCMVMVFQWGNGILRIRDVALDGHKSVLENCSRIVDVLMLVNRRDAHESNYLHLEACGCMERCWL